jgi:hypothetical protein
LSSREAAIAFAAEAASDPSVWWPEVMQELIERLDAHPLEILLDGILPETMLRDALPNVWTTQTNHPSMWAETAALVRLFRRAGFVSDFKEVPAPTEVLTVYRGVAVPSEETVRGMSWTAEPSTAEWFAHRHDDAAELVAIPGYKPTVFRAMISPEGVLARFFQQGEDEVLVDPTLLQDLQEYRPVTI